MFVNPAIIGLISCSILVTLATVYASIQGVIIAQSWDIESGSEKQLRLERRTYLVSTLVSYVMVCELFSLFLYVTTADHIHSFFTGAMCAAGTLYASRFGYLTLVVRMTTFILSSVWLIINYVDNRGYDYPLIRFKYYLLVPVTLIIVMESVLQFIYLSGLDPEIITSCCGALFSKDSPTIAGELVHLPAFGIKITYYTVLFFTLGTGLYFIWKEKLAVLYSLLSTGLFILSLAAMISFISLYFYELPTHHCPFCLLQKEYHYIGYLMYLALFGGVIAGISLGLLHFFRKRTSLRQFIPFMQKKLCCASMFGFLAFAIISTYQIIFSPFILEGY